MCKTTTFYKPFDNGFEVLFGNVLIKAAAEMVCEHYPKRDNASVFVGTSHEDLENYRDGGRASSGRLYVHVNLEHKCPVDENGGLPYCNSYWTDKFNGMWGFFDEIWDFQIENYEYFRFWGFGKKYRFKPLRYTTCLERFVDDNPADYDYQFECVVDTKTREGVMNVLTSMPAREVEPGKYEVDPPRLDLLMSNTNNCDLKFSEKSRCRYGMDFPHYDTPCTINTYRIFEYLCMNKPVVVWDRDRLTSREYFGDLCIWLEDFNAWNLKQTAKREPRTDIAETFRQMTYSDKDYDEYRLNIIRDYKERTGITVPDSVMD